MSDGYSRYRERKYGPRTELVIIKAQIEAHRSVPLFNAVTWMTGTLLIAGLVAMTFAVPLSVFVTLMIVASMSIIGNHRDALGENYWRRKEASALKDALDEEVRARDKATEQFFEARREVNYLKKQLELQEGSKRYG